MNKIYFFRKYVLSTLWRYKLYVLLAMLSIVFGTVSIIVTQSLYHSTSEILSVDNKSRTGGELALRYTDNSNFREEDLNYLKELKDDGLIGDFEEISVSRNTSIIKRLNNEESGYNPVQLVFYIRGIQPETFPIYGDFKLKGDDSLSEIGLDDGEILISKDLATIMDLDKGSEVKIMNTSNYKTDILTIAGVVEENPTNSGREIYVNLENLESIYPDNTKRVVVNEINIPKNEFTNLIFNNTDFDGPDFIVDSQEVQRSNTEIVLNVGLNGLGIIALIFAGVGVTNSLRVLSTKLIPEVAIFKTIGYSNRTILLIFIITYSLIGLTGSLIGVLIGNLSANHILTLLLSLGGIIVSTDVPIQILITSFLVMFLLTVIFSSIDLYNPLRINPAQILSRQSISNEGNRKEKFILYFFLWIFTCLLAAVILKNVLYGFIVLTVSILGLLILRLALTFFVSIFMKIRIPRIDRKYMIAKLHLKNEKSSMVLPLMAILAGMLVITIVFSLRVFLQDNSSGGYVLNSSYSYIIYGDEKVYDDIESYFSTNNHDTLIVKQLYINTDYSDNLEQILIDSYPWGNNILEYPQIRSLEIRQDSKLGAEYSYEHFNGREGNSGMFIHRPYCCDEDALNNINNLLMDVRINDNTYSLPLVGTFERKPFEETKTLTNSAFIVSPGLGLIINEASINEYMIDMPQIFDFRIEVDRLSDDEVNYLNNTFDIFIISADDFQKQTANSVQVFTRFAITLSSLSIIAAVILIFTVASLKIEERKDMLIMLRAIGYSKPMIVALNIYEFAYLAILSIILSLLLSPIIISLINRSNEALDLKFDLIGFVLSSLLIVLVITISIALLTLNALLEQRLRIKN